MGISVKIIKGLRLLSLVPFLIVFGYGIVGLTGCLGGPVEDVDGTIGLFAGILFGVIYLLWLEIPAAILLVATTLMLEQKRKSISGILQGRDKERLNTRYQDAYLILQNTLCTKEETADILRFSKEEYAQFCRWLEIETGRKNVIRKSDDVSGEKENVS